MKFKTSRISIKHPKRLIIIIVSAVLFVALATYGVFSYLHWQKYDQDSQKAATSLKTAIETSLGSDKTSPAPVEQINTIVKNFEKSYGTDPCEVSVWYSWQTVLPQLKEMRDECGTRFETALAVIKTLKPLSQFLSDEKKAAELLAKTIEATKAATDYTAASTTWKEASESDQLSQEDSFKALTAKSTEVAIAISTAYTALATAVSKEDKTGFDNATKDLQTAYAGIEIIKTLVNEERTKLIKVFIAAYEKL